MKMTSGEIRGTASILVRRMEMLNIPAQTSIPDHAGKCPRHFSIAFPTALVYTENGYR
jgi:hypothetical protein